MDQEPKLYTFTVKTIDGKDKSLSDYKGKVLMIVNVASKCGHTPQYKGLQALYEKYKDQGFVILGFPANNFLWQEPGTDDEIKNFCTLNYGVTFDMFSKISVKGKDQHPLYRYLTEESPVPGAVKWNFQKYLVDRNGNVVEKFAPGVKPDEKEVIDKIEQLLREK
ncbi:MAG: glutathione peroxidase [Bacteroidetes bacterium]|nr:glutathione peroxidase [Bacteroidota bacterium]